MKNLTPIIDFRQCKGIENRDDTIRQILVPSTNISLKDNIYPVVDAVDVDIDDTQMVRKRLGRTKVYTGTNLHSLCYVGGVTYFVEGSTLKRFTTGYSVAVVATLSTTDRMRYAIVANKAYCTNGTDIGVLDNLGFTPFNPDLSTTIKPTNAYKLVMPAGQLISYHKNRLYVAKGSKVYVSDPASHMVYDIREGFMNFSGYVTLLCPVEDGIWLSDGRTHWIDGLTPDKFTSTTVANYNATLGSAITVEQNFVEGKEKTKVAFWLSSKGICRGASGGDFKNLTLNKYNLTNVPRQYSAVFRNSNHSSQIVFAGEA
jgi:hypothetical protein